MKKFIFSIAMFLAGVIGFFGTLIASIAGGEGSSSCFSYVNTWDEYLLLGLSVAFIAAGLYGCIKQLKEE